MEELDRFIEFLKRNKLVLISYTLIIILSGAILYIYLNNNKKETTSINQAEIITEEVKEETVFVDIKGAVQTPGTYEVLKGKRVKDVIDLAGGLNENADTSVNNLSLKVTDEMSIIIYTKEEVENFTKVKEIEQKKEQECNNSYIKNDSCISYPKENTDTGTNKLISINTATKEELMTLPGIGEKKALDIINYREENGDFNSIEDIKNVTGIAEALYAQIKEYITT